QVEQQHGPALAREAPRLRGQRVARGGALRADRLHAQYRAQRIATGRQPPDGEARPAVEAFELRRFDTGGRRGEGRGSGAHRIWGGQCEASERSVGWADTIVSASSARLVSAS